MAQRIYFLSLPSKSDLFVRTDEHSGGRSDT